MNVIISSELKFPDGYIGSLAKINKPLLDSLTLHATQRS